MNGDLTTHSGLHDVLPTLFGYIGVGLAFGIVGQTSHLSILEILLMSLLVYAGSAQFVITSMILAGSPIPAMILSTFLVNARMILMSTTIAQFFRKSSLRQNIAIGTLLTDETFALGMSKLNFTNGQLKPTWFNTANIVAYLVWALSTVIGGLLGNLITNPKAFGFDFALVAMFIGLLYLQIIGDRQKKIGLQLWIVLAVIIMMYGLLIVMSANMAILCATILGCLLGMVVTKK